MGAVNILILDNNKVRCPESYDSYQWYYQRTLNVPVHNMGNAPQVNYIGQGYYTCNAVKNGVTVVYMTEFGNISTPHKTERIRHDKEWNFDKIPPREYPNIIKLVKQQRWRTLLITIHNRYKLSENNYCCSLKPIEKKFSKFVDDLQGI